VRARPASEGRPSFFNGGSQSGSAAVAAIKDNYEFVVAYSKHVQGNDFAGTNVSAGITFKPAANATGGREEPPHLEKAEVLLPSATPVPVRAIDSQLLHV
jgi:hypothetical protein